MFRGFSKLRPEGTYHNCRNSLANRTVFCYPFTQWSLCPCLLLYRFQSSHTCPTYSLYVQSITPVHIFIYKKDQKASFLVKILLVQ